MWCGLETGNKPVRDQCRSLELMTTTLIAIDTLMKHSDKKTGISGWRWTVETCVRGPRGACARRLPPFNINISILASLLTRYTRKEWPTVPYLMPYCIR